MMFMEPRSVVVEDLRSKLVAALDEFANVGARAQIERALILPSTETLRPWDEYGDGHQMESRVWCARLMPLLLNTSLIKSRAYPSLNAGLRTHNIEGVLSALLQIVTDTIPVSGNLGPQTPGAPTE